MKTFNLTCLAAKQDVQENDLIVVHPDYEPITFGQLIAGIMAVAIDIPEAFLEKPIGWNGSKLNITKARLSTKPHKDPTNHFPYSDLISNFTGWYHINEEIGIGESKSHFINYNDARNPFVLTVEYVKGLINHAYIHQAKFNPSSKIFSDIAEVCTMVNYFTMVNMVLCSLSSDRDMVTFANRAAMSFEHTETYKDLEDTEDLADNLYKDIAALVWSEARDRDNKWCLVNFPSQELYVLAHVDGLLTFFTRNKDFISKVRINTHITTSGSNINFSRIFKDFTAAFLNAPEVKKESQLEVTEEPVILSEDKLTDKASITRFVNQMGTLLEFMPDNFDQSQVEITQLINLSRLMREELYEIEDHIESIRKFERRRMERRNLRSDDAKSIDRHISINSRSERGFNRSSR